MSLLCRMGGKLGGKLEGGGDMKGGWGLKCEEEGVIKGMRTGMWRER